MKKIYFILLLFFSANISAWAQTGPAGVGTGDGSSGPRNVLWLRSDMGVTQSGTVSAWADQSGNGLNAVQVTGGLQPSYTASNGNLNGLPSISFGPTGSANFHLAVPDNDLLDNSSEMSFFVVLRTSGTSGVHAFLNKRTGFNANQSYRFFRNDATFVSNIGSSSNNSLAAANSTNYILSSIYDQSLGGDEYNFFSNSTVSNGSDVSTTLGNESSPLIIGNFNVGDTRSFPGDLAEIIIYRNALNTAERIIVENYLSEKYDISITGNDFFGTDTNFDAAYVNDINGIGTSDGIDKVSLSGSSDIVSIEEKNLSLNATSEYVLFAHDGAANPYDFVTDDITVVTGELDTRLRRSWFLQSTGSVAASIRVDLGAAGFTGPFDASNYVLLYRPTISDQFTRLVIDGSSIENTDELVIDASNLTLPTGYYTIGEGSPLVVEDLYSFQSGNWTDASTWTTDPSGATRVPAGGVAPTSDFNFTILSGRTVTMDTDDNDGVALTVNGRLNVENTSDHNFFSIAGNGTISIAGDDADPLVAVDNFPTGGTTVFADSIVGGTVEILGAGLSLNAARTYNNVIVNLNTATDVATMLADYQINGDLTIQRGILQINDNASTTTLNISAFGNVQLDASGEINTGTADARHEFNFYGDFTNNGRAEFTNRTTTDYDSEATNGIVDANFLSEVSNQSIDCNGVTNFYRIEIDKGDDQTYILDINALSAANFNLFGPANFGNPSDAQLTTNDNALGLLRGTVRLNTNVDVPVLNNTGNYNISEAARLWINGGSAEKPSGEAIVPYGTVQVSGGALNAPVRSGITTRGNGSIVVTEGIVTVNQIRTSVLGAENIGGYFQSGGTVNVTGQNVQQDYYTFSLTYSGNTFNMSGGTLRVAGSDTFNDNTGGNSGQIHGGGIFINSVPGNISVTGGTVIIENNSDIDFKVTSRAPFWNVIMRSTGGTATEVDLDEGTSGDDSPGEFETIINPELLVLNDLTIEDGVIFDHNGFDVEIGSDLTIQTTGEYLYDAGKPNTTTINGVDDATLNLQNRVDGNGEQRFWNLIINKPAGRVVSLGSGKTDVSGSANNLVRVDGEALKVLSGTLDNGQYSIRVFSDSLVNYDVLGVYDPANNQSNGDNDFIKLTDQPIRLVTADTSRFGNVRFNNNTDIVELTSNVYIERFQYRFGRMNLGEHNLRIDALDINLSGSEANWNGCGGCFSVEDMFITNGNTSDGGLSLYIPADGLDPEDGNSTFDFPFGIGVDGLDAFVDTGSGTGNSKYTPASVTLSGVTDDGYITIRPVDAELGTTDPSGGDLLSYYWRVDFEEFSALPTVEYDFIYNETDIVGSETSYVAGKVLDGGTFNRRFEDDNTTGVPGVVQNEGVNTGTNVITFNGDADTGFTLEAANYTAGESTRFVGAPTIYYSRNRASGLELWNDPQSWSTDPVNTHLGGGGTGAEFPQAGDVAIIGYNSISNADFDANCNPCTAQSTTTRHDINLNGITVNVAELIFDSNPVATAFENNNSRIRVSQTATLNAERVSGHGTIFETVNNTNRATITGDFGSFVDKGINGWFFRNQGTNVDLSSRTEYPTLRIFNGTTTSSVNDISAINLVVDNDATLRVAHNIVVDSLVLLGLNGNGNILFPDNSGSNVTLSCDSLIMDDNNANTNSISVENAGSDLHTLRVNRGISLVEATTFDLSSSGTNVILEFAGEGNHVFENVTAVIPDLYQIRMNKGSNITSTFTMETGFTIPDATAAFQPIEIVNGLLRINNANLNAGAGVVLANGSDFLLPNTNNTASSSGSGGIDLQAGTLRIEGANTGIILDGTLRISGGMLDMDDAGNNNFIEYSASRNAVLEISAGTLDVGSQIRPILTAQTGVLKYRQTGGDVRIGTQAAPEGSRGMLQIYNNESEFTYTGGTLTIERHQTSPTVAALFLNPDESNVTETIQIFNGNTPTSQNNFGINSVISLNNLTIDGSSGNSPEALISINPLTIDGELNITTGATLNGNARTLTVSGDFINDGIYDGQNNETIFNATSSQLLTGLGTNSFFRFTKSESGTLNLANAIGVNSLFTISDGALNDNGNTITLLADAVIDGIHNSSGGEGLLFAGSAQQELRRSEAGTGILGIITINNNNGVNIPGGNGYNFNVDNGVRLALGVFNVGGASIVLGNNAEFTAVNAFSQNNMISTNSSFTDFGVTKNFNANYTNNITFPVGQTFFTPVSFDFGAGGGNTFGTSAGSITVLPANEPHPTVDDGTDALGTGDVNNVLQYYWTITANNITGLTAEMSLGYDQSMVFEAEPGTNFEEDDYIAARIRVFDNPMDNIDKFTTAEVDDVNNIITFDFNGVGTSSPNLISGDYFAGLDEAIPDVVATYIAQGLGGLVDSEIYDIPLPLGAGTPPSGSVIVIPSGATVRVEDDNLRLFRMEIQDGGVLEIDNSTNHRLGQLSGTGTLRILSDGINANLPAFSGNFLSCAGGGLEYGGAGNYDVMSGITEVRSLTISGSVASTKTFANNNVTVCEDFTINGPSVALQNNRRLTVLGSILLEDGVFDAPPGSSARLNVFGDGFTISGGTFNGASAGLTNVTGDFTINGGTANMGSSLYIFRVGGDISLNGGSFTAGSGNSRVEIVNFGGNIQNSIISGNFTGGNSFNNLAINKTLSSTSVNLSSSIEVDGVLSLVSGLVISNGNDLSLGSVATVNPNIGRSNSYVTGNVRKTLSASGSSFQFPVGSIDRWRPASVNSVSVAGATWEAQFFGASAVLGENAPPNEVINFTPTDPAILTLAENEYWKISDGNAGASATVGLSWGTESDVSAVFAEREELEVMIWNDGTETWDNLNGANFSSGHTQSEGRFTAGISNGFSEKVFTLGSPTLANPLPISLKSFEGQLVDNVIRLNWVTSSEINNDYFELQKSSDGISYEVIATIDGSGNTTEEVAYNYLDRQPFIGRNYYRLRQVDFDGQFSIEDEIVIVDYVPENLPLSLSVYPNPTNESSINLRIESDVTSEVRVTMFDLFGKKVVDKVIDSSDYPYGEMRLVPSESLNQGMYIITLEQFGKKVNRKVLIK